MTKLLKLIVDFQITLLKAVEKIIIKAFLTEDFVFLCIAFTLICKMHIINITNSIIFNRLNSVS